MTPVPARCRRRARPDPAPRLLSAGNGVLRLEPAWVARDFLPPGRRLGLPEDAYDVGERGSICERWLGSTTRADNRVGPADEGLSYARRRRRRAAAARGRGRAPPRTPIMGAEYAASHPPGWAGWPKLFDYGARLPYHIHPPQEYASLVGAARRTRPTTSRRASTWAPHPETFLGVHPWIARRAGARHAAALPRGLGQRPDPAALASAELQVADEGFLVPSGVLHAPGTRAHARAAGGLRRASRCSRR